MIKFDVRTGCGNDATPPTVFSCISQPGLEATTCLLWREQVRDTLFVRLPKTEGGSRLIGLMNSLAWVVLGEGSKNRSCTDAAFGQAVRAEAGILDGGNTVSMLADLTQVLRDNHPCRDLKPSTNHTFVPARRVALSRHVWRQKKDLRPRQPQQSSINVARCHGWLCVCEDSVWVLLTRVAVRMTASHVRVSFRAYKEDVALRWTGWRTNDTERIFRAAQDLYKKLRVLRLGFKKL